MKVMKAWKGLLVAVLLLCSFLCVANVNTSAVSAAGEHTHPICGKTHTDIGDHTAAKCETVTYTAWDGTFASSGMPDIDYSNNDTAYVYLTRSVEITYELEIPKGKSLYLCLNGYTITKTEMSDTWSAVILSRSGNTHFILCDCKGGGTITHADGVLGRGVRSGNSDGHDKSSFTMYGGTISGNRVGGDTSGDDGAGVYVQSGTFKMYGGKITDNHVEKSLNDGGGGVLFRSDDTFIMYGGEISNNYSVDYGGGIIAIGYGSVELRGGTISGNTSDAVGGAIWSNKSVTIFEGVSITGNKAVDGGGICTYNTSLTINGGNITNNTVTTGNGGGVYLNGGTFTISGNVKISGNKKGSSANNVYLPKDKTISVIGELTGTTPIGITTKAVPSSSAYVRLAFGRAEYLDPAKFQYENDSNISLVTVGSSSTSSLIACKHNWGTTWQADASGHWHECSLCGGKQAAAEHSGGKATCTESAVCSTCNTPYGSALEHDFTSDVWQKDDNNHWKKCSRCETTDQTAAHTWEDEITLAATCTATGIKTYTCTTCLKTKTETINAKGHNITQHDAKDATCTTIGWKAYEDCSDCDYTTYVEIPAYGHDFTTSVWQKDETNHWKKCSRCDEIEQTAEHTWNEEITVAATCTAAGLKTYTCTTCLKTKTETINAKGHNITKHDAKDATCTTVGWKTYEDCSDCDYTTYVEIAAYGHDFSNTNWQRDGKEHWKKCSRCDATEQTAEHTWNDGEITIEPNCTATGRTTFTCTVCFVTKIEVIDALGHIEIPHKGRDATCTEYGWKPYVTCERCDYTTYEKISALGHDKIAHEAQDATCTTIGWKAYDTCSRCDYTTYAEIAAFGHDFSGDVWQKDESRHWKECSRCGTADTKNVHAWDTEITVAPTCTAEGLRTYTCIDCRATKTETIAANGHILTAHEAKAATCTEIGWKAYENCADCDYTTYVEIAAFGHDFTGSVWQKDENKHWKMCSRCDETAQTAEHTWNEEITIEPTCTAAGRKTLTCAVCLATKTETIAANGHNLTAHEAKAATCTEIGWKAYENCADCDYTTYVEIAAFGHDFTGSVWQKDENKHWKKCSRCDEIDQAAEHTFGDGEITLEPTCTATGLKTYTCTVCFGTKTETIDALGHDEVRHDGKAATCTEFGWKPYMTCNRCEYTTYEKLNALGHDKIHHEAKAATCLEIGYNAYDTCSRCYYTTYVEIAALGHDEIHHDGKAATCTEIGYNAYDTCSRCDYTTYVEIAALGHDEIHHEAKAATCTEIGYNAYDTCSRCDYTTYVEIAALGHDFTAAGWQSNADEHWKNCARCDATAEKASHAGGTATCKDVAVCSTCSATYGELNPDNHAGGTEIRDMVEATAEKVGHTGNSYCKGCNAKIADGKVIPVTVDLSIDQKSDLETAAEAIEKFLSEQNESYTDEQKEELSGSINAIKSALESIARAEDAVSKIEAMPSAADTKPDDKTAIDAFEAAKAAYDALSDDEKRMTGDNSKTALEVMFKALTAYAVTDGNGSTWTESDNGGLTFTVNGYHEKFAGLVINGETVDKKYYDVKAGSTVITLKAEYLKTLTAGKYTILVQYADGSTDGEDAFTVKENGSVIPPDSSSSQTSEGNSSQPTESNKSIVIWIVIPIILIILLILLLLLLKNRKKNGKKK